ncbi:MULTISPECIES: hypothetical protein [unclassified Mycobacterium]|uniref:hypothetical protein n=1 Tax=unclassified Mycobacterium TaxID=2642494 RepID=UPI00096F848A|nr:MULTISPECIES: hypothetical protein [unclassified Mycobacterium]OMC21148.1 hypothetical protein A5736_00615 [Mycobacterium sp. SP-6446]OMC56521.1 hypothetical protein A5747_07890 [Mycobacterium sp. IS-836]
MASPRQPDHPRPDDPAEPPAVPYDADESRSEPPRVIRLRVAAWDVICTVVLLALLIVLATATSWPSKLYGFLPEVCSDETCGPVPYGIDMYIYPLVWGGVGAAVAAAGIGPFVSLLKGWYMSFWPVLALAIVVVSSAAASMITVFSQRYWH